MSSQYPEKETTTKTNNHAGYLHDCLALGAVEIGLESRNSELEEIHRLPLLLRWLSPARSLTSIPTYKPKSQDDEEEGDIDVLVEQAVARMEDRAAMYSAAEGVETIACHLAPAVSKSIGKLNPLKKVNEDDNNNAGTYDTTDLEMVALNPIAASSSSSARRRRSSIHKTTTARASTDDELEGRADDGGVSTDDDDEDLEMNMQHPSNRARTDGTERDGSYTGRAASLSMVAAEDSQEFMVVKTLQELAQLTVKSLKHPTGTLSMDDSILAEEARRGGGIALEVEDLGSTVASLMHHAPVLRHRHVADALCRAAVPQAAEIVARMGANCPTAVPSLLRGCLQVVGVAVSDNSSEQQQQLQPQAQTTAIQAIRRLADLSSREAQRILGVLQREHLLIDVQLELAMKEDPLVAACLLVENLPPPLLLDQTTQNDEAGQKLLELEAAADEPITTLIPSRSLESCLQQNSELVGRVLVFLKDQLSIDDEGMVSTGRTCIVLNAYSRLLLWILVDFRAALRADVMRRAGLRDTLRGLLEKLQHVVRKEINDDTLPDDSQMDRICAIATVATLLTVTNIFAMNQKGQEKGGPEESGSLLALLFTLKGISRKIDLLLARCVIAIKYVDPLSLFCVIHENLFPDGHTDLLLSIDGSALNQAFVGDLVRLCESTLQHEALRELLSLDKLANNDRVMMDPVLLLQQLARDKIPLAERLLTARRFLSTVLNDQQGAATFLRNPRCSDSINQATSMLSTEILGNVPLVLPVQIERLASVVDLHGKATQLCAMEALFVLQVFYCFNYLDHNLESPFCFDPRILPIRQIYALVNSPSSDIIMHRSVATGFADFTKRRCPEVLHSGPSFSYLAGEHRLAYKKKYIKMLTRCVNGGTELDPNGYLAERVFIDARHRLNDADLICSTACALLSGASGPQTFSTLYRDPLIILKSNLSVWTCSGLRRVALTLLNSLLELNEIVVRNGNAPKELQDEYLYSRNQLVVRSMLAISTKPTASARHCVLTCCLVRTLVSQNSGLAAALIKQCLEQVEIDWLVENIPEMIEDWAALQAVLRDRSSLTSTECLTIADGILRIAVLQGFRRPEEAAKLVYSSMSQLISAFFLVLGPVGVPVNSLASDGDGFDATQVSRKAAFRMLKALLQVKGYRAQMKRECAMALQKLNGLCKGESIVSNLPSTIANRRGFLKEFMDAIAKALEAIGCGAQGST